MQNNLQFGMDMSHPTTRSKVASFLLSLAIFIFVFLGASYILTTCEWAIHLPLFRYNIIIAFIIAIASITYLSKELFITKKQIVFVVVLFVIITLIGIFLNSILYNLYVDGNWYHTIKLVCFKHGWNPDYESFHNFLAHGKLFGGMRNIDDATNTNAVEHMPSATEILCANFYIFTNNFQESKVINILMLVACFSLIFSFLSQFNTLKLIYIFLFSILFTANTLGLQMLFDFMVEPALYYYMLSILIVYLWYAILPKMYHYFLLVAVLSILINIKFSGLLIFFGVFFIFLVCLVLYYKKITFFLTFLLISIIVSILSVVLWGFHPYVNNVLTEGNIFYPAMGGHHPADLLDFYNNLLIAKEHNYIIRFLYSLFIRTEFFDNAFGNPMIWYPSFKLPFLFTVRELILSGWDSITGGFGPFYGGILIVGFCFYVYHVFKNRKDRIQQVLFFVFLFVLITVLMVPMNYYYRYVPQAWLLPIIIMFSLVYPSSFNFKIIAKGYVTFASILLFVTIFFASLQVYFISYYDTKDMINKIDYIYNKYMERKVPVHVRTYIYYSLPIMLEDKGVTLYQDSINNPFLDNNKYMTFEHGSSAIVAAAMKRGDPVWGINASKGFLKYHFFSHPLFEVERGYFDTSLYNFSLDSSWLYKHIPYHDMLYR